MSDTTSPATPRTELLDPDKFPSYLVNDARSIVQHLRQLAEKRVLLSVFLNANQSFVSTLLDVDGDTGAVTLDCSPDESLNQRVFAANHVTCLTRLDGIRVQFALPRPQSTKFEGSPALRFALPERLLRLQRRESYRLPVPINAPARCRIKFKLEDGSLRTEELRVLDISNDGVALLLNKDSHNSLPLEPAQVLEHCELLMPEFPPMPIVLRVRNRFEVQAQNNIRHQRIGCEFVDLPNKISTTIQRYIFKIERERRALN